MLKISAILFMLLLQRQQRDKQYHEFIGEVCQYIIQCNSYLPSKFD